MMNARCGCKQGGMLLAVIVVLILVKEQARVDAFTSLIQPSLTRRASVLFETSSSSSASTTKTTTTTTATKEKLLPGNVYVATNRFSVRKNKEAKFEQRWANRKSQLAECEGFEYFHLMRRVNIQDDGTNIYSGGFDDDNDDEVFGNYVSFTLWNKKANFNKWRKGSAFKEAHGGTSIGAFLKTMIGSARTLRGAPSPKFYNGLLFLQQEKEETSSDWTVEGGWRKVNANGISTLPTECFVACNQFYVPSENAMAFEQMWANRKSQLQQCNGFVFFSMLRPDTAIKGGGGGLHGMGAPRSKNEEPSYISCTVWKDRASFDNWRNGQAFVKGHGGDGDAKNKKPSGDDDNKPEKKRPLWTRPPKPVFYEGTLVLNKPE